MARRQSLADQLAARAAELRTKEDEKNAASDALAIASSNAAIEAQEAARQAAAVEEAFMVLDQAGVTL